MAAFLASQHGGSPNNYDAKTRFDGIDVKAQLLGRPRQCIRSPAVERHVDLWAGSSLRWSVPDCQEAERPSPSDRRCLEARPARDS